MVGLLFIACAPPAVTVGVCPWLEEQSEKQCVGAGLANCVRVSCVTADVSNAGACERTASQIAWATPEAIERLKSRCQHGVYTWIERDNACTEVDATVTDTAGDTGAYWELEVGCDRPARL